MTFDHFFSRSFIRSLREAGRLTCALSALSVFAIAGCDGGTGGDKSDPENPVPAASAILFVTQTPYHTTFDTVTATFGNHKSSDRFAPRGGDLMIIYPNGTLRNLTKEAGFGLGAEDAIAVREPNVHWDGKRAVFSMVIGGVTKNNFDPVFWQLYEITGLGEGDTAQITKVDNQPETFNNVSPAYGSDGRIVFTSDRPRSGEMRHYPQLDEYESVETNSGVWSMDPSVSGGGLKLLSHVPSGAFSPKVALDGRIIYVRWDHLQRDQQGDTPALQAQYGAVDYLSEDSDEQITSLTEDFPEERDDASVKPGNHRHQFNQFFPWEINQDGTNEETVNHVGRHEMVDYIESSRDGLPYGTGGNGHTPITNFFHVMEDLANPGTFYGVNAPEFGTHTSGAIVKFNGAIGVNAADMYPMYVTDPETAAASDVGEGGDGLYRNPVPLSDGDLLAVVNLDARAETNVGEGPFGNETYKFRIRHITKKEGTEFFKYGAPITEGITDTVSYFNNQAFTDVTYSGEMWELDPVEVTSRPMPLTVPSSKLPAIEDGIISSAMVANGGVAELRKYLTDNNLALVISRDVTIRADEQQPYNLSVPGGVTTAKSGETPDEIEFLQFYQADQVRGYTEHREGRRPIARPMHSAPDGGESLKGAYRLGKDGSVAALVPAQRAMTWQLTSGDGTPIVRERYWVTFQPGEIRVCPNCHGLNKVDVVLGEGEPTNPPETLAPLIQSLFQ